MRIDTPERIVQIRTQKLYKGMKVIIKGMDCSKSRECVYGLPVAYNQIKHGRIRVSHGDLGNRFS